MEDLFDDEDSAISEQTLRNDEQTSTENKGMYVYSQAEALGDKGGEQGEIVRNERGQFVKGYAVPSPARKRKPKANEQALIAALHEALPAERVGQLLEQALAWAQEYKSPKLVLAILQFHYSYTLGMPVQRSVTASTKLETILNRLGEMDDSEFANVEQAMRRSE